MTSERRRECCASNTGFGRLPTQAKETQLFSDSLIWTTGMRAAATGSYRCNAAFEGRPNYLDQPHSSCQRAKVPQACSAPMTRQIPEETSQNLCEFSGKAVFSKGKPRPRARYTEEMAVSAAFM